MTTTNLTLNYETATKSYMELVNLIWDVPDGKEVAAEAILNMGPADFWRDLSEQELSGFLKTVNWIKAGLVYARDQK